VGDAVKNNFTFEQLWLLARELVAGRHSALVVSHENSVKHCSRKMRRRAAGINVERMYHVPSFLDGDDGDDTGLASAGRVFFTINQH
jgi:hypothetical protein